MRHEILTGVQAAYIHIVKVIQSARTMATERRLIFIGCLFSLLIPYALSALNFDPNNVRNQSYVWGYVGPRDRHLAGAVLKFPRNVTAGLGFLRKEYQTPKLGWGTRITAIQFIDKWQNGTNANITELTTNANMTSARAVLVSQRGKGMDFTIRIWGH